MSFIKTGALVVGRLLILISLAVTFMVGMLGVFYMSLTGEEITIPKIVGKNFNVGQDELVSNGLRIRKIATRYSEEALNTILEQRPRAGTPAKSGLMISVVVSKENPDASEAPADVKEDEEDNKEIEDLPELNTDKSPKKKKKTSSKTRDVIQDESKLKEKEAKTETADAAKDGANTGADKKTTTGEGKAAKPNVGPPPKLVKPTQKPKANDKKPAGAAKPKPGVETRKRRVQQSN